MQIHILRKKKEIYNIMSLNCEIGLREEKC